MMTPDKDYGQLVSDRIKMYKPGRKGKPVEIVGEKEICEYYGISNPEQVIDILALWGDASDNVPGVPGVGEKTAAKLIAQFGSVEKLLLNVNLLKGKQKENLIASKELLKLSKKLVTIPLDVPVELEIEKLERKEPNKEKLQKIFDDLEFKTMASSILGSSKIQGSSDTEGETERQGVEEQAITSGSYQTIKTIKHDYQLVEKEEEIEKLILSLSGQKEFCFDTETTGLDYHTAELTGIAFSWEKNKAYYVYLPEDLETAKSGF